jgi:ProP effector
VRSLQRGHNMETKPTKSDRKRQLKAVLAKLAELYPACFAADAVEPHRPLKVGIHRDLIERGMQPSEVPALRFYVARPAYKAALIPGSPRYDLDGNPHGEVTAEQIERQRTNAKATHTASIEREGKIATSRLSLADLKAAAQARKSAQRAA